jgi:hypothetical protein
MFLDMSEQATERRSTAAFGTSDTNGDDARRSACRSNPDIAWMSSSDRL